MRDVRRWRVKVRLRGEKRTGANVRPTTVDDPRQTSSSLADRNRNPDIDRGRLRAAALHYGEDLIVCGSPTSLRTLCHLMLAHYHHKE